MLKYFFTFELGALRVGTHNKLENNRWFVMLEKNTVDLYSRSSLPNVFKIWKRFWRP